MAGRTFTLAGMGSPELKLSSLSGTMMPLGRFNIRGTGENLNTRSHSKGAMCLLEVPANCDYMANNVVLVEGDTLLVEIEEQLTLWPEPTLFCLISWGLWTRPTPRVTCRVTIYGVSISRMTMNPVILSV